MFWLFEPHELLVAAPGVQGGGFPCRVLTWVESAKKKPTLYWRKLNEHSENVSFDSEFALAFEIQRFKVAFFVVFLNANFLNANFSFCNIKFSIHFNYLWILSLHLSLGQYYFIKQVSLMHTKMLLVIIKLQFVDSRRPF